MIFGSLGVVWAFFFARWFRDNPATHPEVNDAERRYILGDRPSVPSSGAGQGHPRIPWRLALGNPNIWLLGVINACTSFYSYMLFLWFPTYLKEGRGLDEITSGRVGSMPYLFGATGVLLGGFLGDWLTARTGSRRLALGGMGTVGLILAGTFVASSVARRDPDPGRACSARSATSARTFNWPPGGRRWATSVAATWGRCSVCAAWSA